MVYCTSSPSLDRAGGPTGSDCLRRPFESSYVHNLSRELKGLGSSTVEWELLHSFSPARAIIESFGVDPATRLDSVSQRGPAIPEIDS